MGQRGNREASRGPTSVMKWYDSYCRYKADTMKRGGGVHSADVIGVVACYLWPGLAL